MIMAGMFSLHRFGGGGANGHGLRPRLGILIQPETQKITKKVSLHLPYFSVCESTPSPQRERPSDPLAEIIPG
jgi:hypothetical protein